MTASMFDWLTARTPCFHPFPIDGGRVLKLSPEGEKVWEVASRLPVVGSYDSNLLIRTYGYDSEGRGLILEISGNPTKFLQGHNLFGGFDQPGPLMEMTMYRLCELLPGLQPTDLDLHRWRDGSFEFTRVDVNTMYALGSRARVRAWLRAAEHAAYLRHRGKGTLMRENTLYFGQGSKRSVVKFYGKGDELEAGRGHGLHLDLLEAFPQLPLWADDKLRFEVMLRSKELQQRGLRWALDWSSTTAAEILNGIAEGIQMSDQKTLPTTAITNLPHRLRMAYESWLNGVDLRGILPKNTFYRYRRALLPYGIDIAICQPHQKSNVVPLIQVIEAVPCGPPEWAYGTTLLVGPSNLIEARSRFLQRKAA